MKTYRAIPKLGTGRGRLRVGVRQRLYEAEDHLLVVESTGITEEYRRFFYRDILSVVIRKTRRRLWYLLALLVVLAGLMFLPFVGAPWWAVETLAATPFLLLLDTLRRGPACDCYLSTRVQTVIVPVPAHLKKVPLFLRFLETKIGEGGTSTRKS